MAINDLGNYLRARRHTLSPAEVGLPADAGRRVAGLRREEVARLAGISPEYYLRLEQGRDTHPSDQVLRALAAALSLDETATAYLHRIADPPPCVRCRAPAAAGSASQKQDGPACDGAPKGGAADPSCFCDRRARQRPP